MSTEYFDLKNDNRAPVTAVCGVCDGYVSLLPFCPLEELDSDDYFTCSSGCLYYSDCEIC